MGTSRELSENCTCHECHIGFIRCENGAFDICIKNMNEGDNDEDERTPEDYENFDREHFLPPLVTRCSDYDFVAKRRHSQYDWRVARKVDREVRRWHTGNLGTVLRWLLEHHIDTLEHSEKIDKVFSLLYRAGSVALAFVLGMYASRDVVHAEIQRFHSKHAGPRTPAMRHIEDSDMFKGCDGICSCWAECTSSECRVAVHMLANARNVSLPTACTDYTNYDWEARLAYVNALFNVSDAEVMMTTVDLLTETIDSKAVPVAPESIVPLQPAAPESIVSLSWRRLLVADGMTALLGLPKHLVLPESYAAYTQAAYRRVHLLSDRFYVNELLQRDDSILGKYCHLLGRCEPCIAPRRKLRMGNSGGERISHTYAHPSLENRIHKYYKTARTRYSQWQRERSANHPQPDPERRRRVADQQRSADRRRAIDQRLIQPRRVLPRRTCRDE